MKPRRPAVQAVLPIPLSILLTLLWTGLVHLIFLGLRSQTLGHHHGTAWADLFWTRRLVGGVRLPTVLVAICLLLLIHLWLDYRSRPAGGRLGWVFLAAAVLLVYLSWAVWQLWWRQVHGPPPLEGILLTRFAAAVG